MQKKLIAMAVAGLVTAPAFAQSNVTIYGRMDYGFMHRGGNSGGADGFRTKSELASGIQGGSRIGFRGAEDLGNGLKAVFQAEYGVNIDSNQGGGGGQFSNRNAHVGLSGNFGTIVGGRLDGVRYGIWGKYDPFANGNVANFSQMTPHVDRADNAIAYISPNFQGLTLTLAYATHAFPAVVGGTENDNFTRQESADGNNGDNRLYTIMLAYDNGPISANIDYEQIRTKGNSDNKLWVATVGGAYDFGVVKVSALYDILKSNEGNSILGEWDTRSWLLGARAPLAGNVVLKAMYGRVKDKEVSSADARKWGIGGDYLLSKRTNFYATYGNIRNDREAGYTISQAGNGFGTGHGTRGFDLGIAHRF